MKELIYCDEYITIIFKAGTTNTLVISFGDMLNLANGLNISAEAPLSKYKHSILGISANDRNWYPRSSILNALLAIHKITSDYSYIVTYGGSMGGYAAIKYSKLLKASKVVSLVPQFSINPSAINERRYHDYFDRELHDEMAISANDIDTCCKYLIVYDPYFKPDCEHFDKIIPLLKNYNIIKLRFSGHHATSILASSGLLNELISENSVESHIYSEIRQLKRKKSIYINSFIDVALKRKSKSTLKFLGESVIVSKLINEKNIKTAVRLMIDLNIYEENVFSNFKINPLNIFGKYLFDHHKKAVVFNILTSCLECYSIESILKNANVLIPVSTKIGILSLVYINVEMQIIMNADNKIMVNENGKDMPDGYFPLILNAKDGYLYISFLNTKVASSQPSGELDFKTTPIKNWEMFKVHSQKIS